MKIHFRHGTFIFLIALIGAGCNTAKNNTATTTTPTTSPAIFEDAAYVPPNGTHELQGSINKNLAITMTLDFNNGVVRGHYQYDKNKQSGVELSVDGYMDGNVLNLDEFPQQDKAETPPSARMRLALTSAGVWAGTWESVDGKKRYDMQLEEVDNSLAEQKTYGGNYVGIGRNFLDVLAITPAAIKFQIHGEIGGDNGWAQHVGDVGGIINRNGSNASYEDESGICKLQFTFNSNTVEVEDNGECGGSGVDLSGEYKRQGNSILNWDIYHIAVP